MREPLGFVAETDLGLVLVLDARANGPLTSHLLGRLGVRPAGPLRAVRSVLGPDGVAATGVTVTWDGGALLVQHRLGDEPLPADGGWHVREAAERRQRGELVLTVLVVPAAAAPATGGLVGFDLVATFEELADVAAGHGDPLHLGAAAVYGAAAGCTRSATSPPAPVPVPVPVPAHPVPAPSTHLVHAGRPSHPAVVGERDRARAVALTRGDVARVRTSPRWDAPVRRSEDRRSWVERRAHGDRRALPREGDDRRATGERRGELVSPDGPATRSVAGASVAPGPIEVGPADAGPISEGALPR